MPFCCLLAAADAVWMAMAMLDGDVDGDGDGAELWLFGAAGRQVMCNL